MTLDEVRDRLKEKYPLVGLSFGYIGNCGLDSRGHFDDRLWMFFTNVPYPWNEHKQGPMSWGGWSTKNLPGLNVADVEARLEKWLVEKVVPRQEERWRHFSVKVAWADAAYTEKRLLEVGASFGGRGGGNFSFSIRRMTLERLKEMLPWAIEVKETDY